MFIWDKKTIEYHNTAEEYSNTAKLIVNNINKYFTNTNIALEIACGTGNTSIELCKYFNKVTCFDIAKEPINFLTNYCKNNNINNIICKNISSKNKLLNKYDLILSIYYYDEENFINIANNNLLDDGVFIILMRTNMKSTMSPFSTYTHRDRCDTLENNFKTNNFKVNKTNFILIKNQPIINKTNLIDFLNIYNNDFKNMNIINQEKQIDYLIKNNILINTCDLIDKSTLLQKNKSLNMFTHPLTKDQINYIIKNKIEFIYKIERPTNIYIIKKEHI